MIINSPIHYMGSKSRLIKDLKSYFPSEEECDTFIDLFGGSGCVSLNVNYKRIIYNEINSNIANLLKIFQEYDSDYIIEHIKKRMEEFNLLKADKKQYEQFRKFYNESDKDILDLYTLTFFSFCNLMRFNSKSEFNMPFGNRCFKEKNEKEIINACNEMKNKYIYIYITKMLLKY